MTTDPTPTCPQCQQPAVPICYGYPGPDMIEAAQNGEILLGGCMVWDGSPTLACANGHRWGGDSTDEFGGNWTDEPPF